MSLKAYKKLNDEVDRLYRQNEYETAIDLLTEGLEKFPEYHYDLYYYRLFCFRQLKRYEACLDQIRQTSGRGYFFDLSWEAWNPLKDCPGYDEVNRRNQELKTAAQKKAVMRYDVLLPEGYSPDNTYPLFITLHGDGDSCNIDYFQKEWPPDPLLAVGFIVVYVQSSQVSCNTGFGWTKDYDKTRDEIGTCLQEVMNAYPIDPKAVICGGFSGGAMASLNIIMNGSFPLAGVVAFCLGKTDNTTPENVQKAADRGVHVVILEGEMSDPEPFQEELMKLFDSSGLRYRFEKIPGIDHQVPMDMGERALSAARFILDR